MLILNVTCAAPVNSDEPCLLCSVQPVSQVYPFSFSAKTPLGLRIQWDLDCLMLMQELALDAVTTVMAEASTGQREIDIKKYVKIEKIPGGAIEDCRWDTLIGHSFHAFCLITVQLLSTLSI